VRKPGETYPDFSKVRALIPGLRVARNYLNQRIEAETDHVVRAIRIEDRDYLASLLSGLLSIAGDPDRSE
jgi:hypothetical protein